MTAKSATAVEGWYAPVDKTSQTDDERIKDVTPLPPPEHLIRFFPIRGTPVEALVTKTRQAIRGIMNDKEDRLLRHHRRRVPFMIRRLRWNMPACCWRSAGNSRTRSKS